MKFNLIITGANDRLRNRASRSDPASVGLSRTIATFEQALAESFATFHVGGSVRQLDLVIELVALAQQASFLRDVRCFTAYRRQRRGLLSVVQLDWPSLEEMDTAHQMQELLRAVACVGDRAMQMKIKPRDFCDERFCQFARDLAEPGGSNAHAHVRSPGISQPGYGWSGPPANSERVKSG